MAIIGSTIGLAFAVSFILAPYLEHAIGVPGIFAMTGVLALAAMAVVRWIVPDAPAAAHAPDSAAFWKALRDPELVRLNVGIFTLHAVLMAMFIVVPFALVRGGLPSSEHWWVYLSTVGGGLVLMLPVIVGRASAHERRVFLASVATIGVSLAVLALTLERVGGVIAALVIFFAGFNVLEAKLPALVSRAAPREATGAATGVYSSVQFLGTFFGAAAGGALAQHAGFAAVLVACLVAVAAWLAVAWNMGDFVPAASPASRT
jgi:predicted MFS family arabinose efflux permease